MMPKKIKLDLSGLTPDELEELRAWGRARAGEWESYNDWDLKEAGEAAWEAHIRLQDALAKVGE